MTYSESANLLVWANVRENESPWPFCTITFHWKTQAKRLASAHRAQTRRPGLTFIPCEGLHTFFNKGPNEKFIL